MMPLKKKSEPAATKFELVVGNPEERSWVRDGRAPYVIGTLVLHFAEEGLLAFPYDVLRDVVGLCVGPNVDFLKCSVRGTFHDFQRPYGVAALPNGLVAVTNYASSYISIVRVSTGAVEKRLQPGPSEEPLRGTGTIKTT